MAQCVRRLLLCLPPLSAPAAAQVPPEPAATPGDYIPIGVSIGPVQSWERNQFEQAENCRP
jgi:hypothetical protein